MREVVLDGRTLTIASLCEIASGARARLDSAARARMTASSEWIAKNNGTDSLRVKWEWLVGGPPPEEDAELIRRFVLGHCAGVGDPLSEPLARALVAARVNVLATGATGCRPECAGTLLSMLNAHVVPLLPAKGSVGAAGSPALAHLVGIACGLGGEAIRDGRRLAAREAMAGIPLLSPTPHEALVLLNGDTLATALAACAVHRSRRLLETAEEACALSFEVARADLGCVSERAMDARLHKGAIDVAERLRAMLAGSEMCSEGRRPDPFSIRCAPIVLGAAWEAIEYTASVVERELNAAASNPIVFPEIPPIEAGNLHGAPVALVMDHLKVALTQVASIAERRIFRMTYGQLSGLPSFLVPGTGMNSGLMLAQYTAASLVSECKGLAHPASVDSIPTIQHREDHVPMSPIAAGSALEVTEMLADVLAIELLCGAQGLDFRRSGQATDASGQVVSVEPLRPGAGTAETFSRVRALVPRWEEDRVLHLDISLLGTAVRQGVFTRSPGAW